MSLDLGHWEAILIQAGKPLPEQHMVTLKQAAGVVLFAALSTKMRDIPAAFIVENEIYSKTRPFLNNDEDADMLWELSERLVGEKFEV
ncbi:hypothetical protein BCR34DRAFT_599815 [Clohesyomyces aquaticus]|uniref:Uncharacterized protein n=1 Tax=Clohesyomyces aquaticus TaxID=1231657 RepID=A0A1Y1ZTV8_9PLEO|nr:hypothetical protein BCR34DRAFT_599815 [Clohesyomyces aquaticus]